MRSIKFPKMFDSTSTKVWQESEQHEATAQNLKLALASTRGELLGDPYFGLLLNQYMFSQNSSILRDMLIDMIYTQVALFIPQLYVSRKDISIIQNKRKGQLICQIRGIDQVDHTLNTYELLFFNTENSV